MSAILNKRTLAVDQTNIKPIPDEGFAKLAETIKAFSNAPLALLSD
jgi:hypothetical protein